MFEGMSLRYHHHQLDFLEPSKHLLLHHYLEIQNNEQSSLDYLNYISSIRIFFYIFIANKIQLKPAKHQQIIANDCQKLDIG
ncbi:hypothetical protein H1P_390026 [Hyella patelloides LEGE 07179]|uniref:Uncharacterized protein n=1 Tax=Hyella patelloides LEGE 07179 TaxID=945734 RepID=A0A563VWX4_9CYAN|nr:hypothetical protein H1P_390026 [Hyella patelloides LEGE 07179]